MADMLIQNLKNGSLDTILTKIYGEKDLSIKKSRAIYLAEKFQETFGTDAEHLFSAPGRTEIGGNHTDHQKGCVLAASINLDALAAVTANNSGKITIQSEGYSLFEVDLADLLPNSEEFGTTTSLVRGLVASFTKLGCDFTNKGFKAYITSDVLSGSGLSSSAAFEVLIANIINTLYFDEKCDPIKIAQMSQYAENVYFGKPCGLMDQMASSVGSVISIDFKDEMPVVKQIPLDFAEMDHALCIVDSGVDHADLTHEYSNITTEMREVSEFFGKTYLSQIDEKDFYENMPQMKKELKGRAILRAIHFFNDNKIAVQEAEAINNKQYELFLNYIKKSGNSSLQCLQNVTETGSIDQQGVLLAITLCQHLLGDLGAVRVHGGGFAGTVQAFVPNHMVYEFKSEYEKVFGEGTCHILSIRPVGGVCIF